MLRYMSCIRVFKFEHFVTSIPGIFLNFNQENLYLYKYFSVCLFWCLSVRLYPIRLTLASNKIRFMKILKIYKIPEIIFVFVLQCIQREHVHNWNRFAPICVLLPSSHIFGSSDCDCVHKNVETTEPIGSKCC